MISAFFCAEARQANWRLVGASSGHHQSDPTLCEDGIIEEQDHKEEEAPNPSLGLTPHVAGEFRRYFALGTRSRWQRWVLWMVR